MFRVIYSVATGIAIVRVRVKHIDGKSLYYSDAFRIRRGLIQGDIIVCVIRTRIRSNHPGKESDKTGKGVKAGSMSTRLCQRVELCEEIIDEMSKRPTAIANASIKDDNMYLKVSKTYSQHVHRRSDIMWRRRR